MHSFYELPAKYRKKRPSTLNITRMSNGERSWVHRPDDFAAEEFEGLDAPTLLEQDFYGDLIGFPIQCGSHRPYRTMARDTGAPYQLDQLIPSAMYRQAGEELIDGGICDVIERPGLDRLWLSRGRGWVIVRREWRWAEGAPLKRRITNRDFREIAEGVWLPYEGRMEVFGHPATRPGQRVGIMHLTVQEASADVRPSELEPDFPKGTLVTRVSSGEEYAFGLTAEQFERVRRQARLDSILPELARRGPVFRPKPWWRSAWVAPCGTILAACAALLFVAVARRLGKRP
jgi:hypothetical protein